MRRDGAGREGARREDGSAPVEFVLIAVVLLVPLVYLVIGAAAVQRAAFAASGAVRDAGRAYATGGSDAAGRAQALAATAVALDGAGVRWSPGAETLTCDPQPCGYAPGSTVTVALRVDVPLPGLGAWLCGPGGCRVSVPVTARHTEVLDCHAPGVPASGRC